MIFGAFSITENALFLYSKSHRRCRWLPSKSFSLAQSRRGGRLPCVKGCCKMSQATRDRGIVLKEFCFLRSLRLVYTRHLGLRWLPHLWRWGNFANVEYFSGLSATPVTCPYRDEQATGLAGGYDYKKSAFSITENAQKIFFC